MSSSTNDSNTNDNASNNAENNKADAKPNANENALGAENQPEGEEGQGAVTKKEQPWYERRIAKLTAKNSAANTQLASALEEIANLRAGKNEDGSNTKLSDAEIEAKIEQKAVEISAQREFNRTCNKIYEKGTKEFDDFDDSVKALQSLGIMTPEFLELTNELDDTHKILHYLGQNPEEADKIQSLPATKQAVALAKIEAKLASGEKSTKKTTSKAPTPITPVKSKSSDGAGYATRYYDGMPQAEYNEWREKSKSKK